MADSAGGPSSEEITPETAATTSSVEARIGAAKGHFSDDGFLDFGAQVGCADLFEDGLEGAGIGQCVPRERSKVAI